MDPDFTIVMRGYERQEVDSYVRDLVAETTRLGERVAELEAQLQRARSGDRDGGAGREEGFRQLGEETTRILVAAETAAREMREKAERDASAEVAAAEKSARKQVEAASQNADRIVAEAEGRRSEVQEEISRLDDVRATLVDNLRGAIRTAERSVEQLPPARNLDGSATATGADTASTSRDDGPRTPDVRIVDPSVEDEDDEDDPADEPAADEPAVEEADEPAADAPEPSAAEEPDEDEPDVDEPAADELAEDDEADEAAGIDPQEELAAEVALADEAADAAVEESTDAPVAEESTDAPVEESTDEPAAEESTEDDDTAAEPHQGADQRAVAAALADADEAAGRVDAEPEAGESDASMLRERSLAGVRPGMLRRLRRGLQELQNGVLEAVRTRDEDADAESLLPADDDIDGLHDVARLFLDAGYRAGRTDAPVLSGGEALQDPPTDTELVGSTAELLAVELLDELRTTLTPSLRAGLEADEPGASLSERVGEVFRDLKGPVVETVVDDHLTAIYGHATLAGWDDEGVSEVRWLLGEESRCPESMCRANAAEGPVSLRSPFPSGHDVPLAHEGCTCALEPA